MARRMAGSAHSTPYGHSLAGRSVLVTGAHGFVGGWLVKALLERGARVAVLRRRPRPGCVLVLEDLERRCEVFDGDIVDAGVLSRALEAARAEVVFHLAATSTVGAGDRAPLETFESNVRGTWTLLEACRAHGADWAIVASSEHAYGPPESLPLSEGAALRPPRPYEASKAAADIIARSYWTAYGLPVATTRFGNVYGGGDQNRSRLIPGAVGDLLAGRRPAIRSDGSPQRDFLHVSDAAAAYLALADALDAGQARGEAFNAGGGEPHSVLDVIERLCRLSGTGLEPDVQGAGTPAGEIDRQWLDSGKLRALTGWAPRVALDDGLRETLAWYRAHPESLAA
jgi:CDP-glucose 4,6-dehydratase